MGACKYNDFEDVSYINKGKIDLVAPGALALIINCCKKDFARELSEYEIYAQLIKRTLQYKYKSIKGNSGYLYL